MKKSENRICLIIPYFGKAWPKYLTLYLWGCQSNPLIDILIFSDIPLPLNTPANVHFFSMTLAEFSKRASKHLDLTINLESGYKLCDLKPAYGLIFDEYLKDYGFWGWGDIDLIYGDLSKYLSQEILSENDAISFHPKWVSGSFFLMKNTQECKSLFQRSKSWKKTFQSTKHTCFDECHFLWEQVRNGGNLISIDPEESFSTVLLKAQNEGLLNVKWLSTLKESIQDGHYLSVQKSSIISGQHQEYMLYHFITEKKKAAFQFPNWKKIPDCFYITNTGFYTENEFNSRLFTIRQLARNTIGLFREANRLKKRAIEKLFYGK